MDIYGSAAGEILAVGFFMLFQLSGLCVSRLALRDESFSVRLVLGSLCGSVMLQWFPVLFAFSMGFSAAAHLCALGLALLCGALCLWRSRGMKPARPRGFNKFYIAVFAVLVFFALLVWRSFLFEDGKIFSSQATYGDTSMHLSFITSIARQGKFPPYYSLLPDCLLSYPFLSDSISSSLYIWGCSLKTAYFLPMVFAGAQVLFGFYLFASRLLGSPKKGALAFLLFFFNGGLGVIYFLGGDEGNFSRIFTAFYQTPTNYTDENIRWVNVIVDMMLPQRATLFGWALLFPTLYLLFRAVYEDKKYFLHAGVLAGLMPMIHTHSFLATALICGGWMAFWLLRRAGRESRAALICKIAAPSGLLIMATLQSMLTKAKLVDSEKLLWFAGAVFALCAGFAAFLIIVDIRRSGPKEVLASWGVLLLAACALAVPQLIFWTFRQAGQSGFIRGHFGWVTGEDNYLLFYLKNIGVTAVLALGGLLTARREHVSVYAPALVIWFFAEFVEFQPNDYDNNKLLYAAFALLCCAGAEFAFTALEKLRNGGLRYAAGAVGLAVCMASAVLTMGREWVAKYEIYGTGALDICRFTEYNFPADATVLTDCRHNNEIAALTGRNIVCGSPAYLYFHGLPYSYREDAARKMYEDPAGNRELFSKFNVDYILVSDFEHSSYNVDDGAIAEMFRVVYDDGVRAFYKVE